MKHFSYHLPIFLFLLLLIVPGMPFAWRAWEISPLYLDATLRHRVELALTQLTDREGWLLSDLAIRSVTPAQVTLVHREHRRLPDAPQCFSLSLSTFETQPCAE